MAFEDKMFQPGRNEVEFAFHLLKEKGQPVHYKELLDFILAHRPEGYPVSPGNLASIYTMINLDTRFVYIGQGLWGLRDWAAVRNPRRIPALSLLHKAIDHDREESRGRDDGDLDDQVHEELNGFIITEEEPWEE